MCFFIDKTVVKYKMCVIIYITIAKLLNKI
jgi:hypothetical protein